MSALLPAVLVCALIAGCGGSQTPATSTTAASVPSFDQSTPQAGVRAYLDAISFAYRTGASDVASQTMSGAELVRVDAYIELNRQQGRSIEQTLTDIEFGQLKGTEPTLTVGATEDWVYRYVPVGGSATGTQELSASYTTEYTVILDDGKWKVDSVKVTPQGAVK